MIDEKTKPVVEILKRVVASGYVRNGYPLSAVLIGEVGIGKTTQLKKIINDGIIALTDITPYGFSKLLPEIKAKNIKHIIIFDLVEPMSRSRSIVNNFIGFMNALIEEGVFRISTAFIEIKEPVKVGLITSTTRSEFLDKRRGWLGIGFISRLIPISYTFTSTDILQILESIANQKIQEIKPEVLRLKEKPIEENPQVFQLLIPYAEKIDDGLPTKPIPFRRLKQLQILLMANALLDNRKRVEMKDFEWFKGVARWINFSFNPL